MFKPYFAGFLLVLAGILAPATPALAESCPDLQTAQAKFRATILDEEVKLTPLAVSTQREVNKALIGKQMTAQQLDVFSKLAIGSLMVAGTYVTGNLIGSTVNAATDLSKLRASIKLNASEAKLTEKFFSEMSDKAFVEALKNPFFGGALKSKA